MNFLHNSSTVGALRASALAAPGSPPRRTSASQSCASDAGLFDGQFPEQAQGGLAALAGVRPVLEHEHLAARRGNLAQEAGHHVSRSSTACAWGCAASTADLVSLILAMMTPRKDPVSQEPNRGQADGSRVKFQKAPAYVELA
jgi:hypothetical protein